MGIISKQYIKNLVHRYDKEVGIPYYSYQDFKGLNRESYTFENSKRVEIHYFFYYYDNYQEDKIILFLSGIGPGHTAYLAEIEQLAKRGYKVLTLDYTGCGESKGEILGSLNMPTLDVVDLLNHLNLKQQIVLVGHSLGGYTSLNVTNLRDDIFIAVILSGFLSIKSLLSNSIHSNILLSLIMKYERKTVPEYAKINNLEYLENTKDSLLFIQSQDDQIVPFEKSLEIVKSIDNPLIKTRIMNHRKHNPNYTEEAVNYMNDVFGKYQKLINDKVIKTDENRINYFKDVSIQKLTEQDEKLFDDIKEFIENSSKIVRKNK